MIITSDGETTPLSRDSGVFKPIFEQAGGEADRREALGEQEHPK